MNQVHSNGAGGVLDPVCGMTIDRADASGTSQVGGTTYHFCSPACKRKFDADPERYAEKDESSGACDVGHGCCH